MRTVLDFIDSLASCDVEHRGPLLDLGGRSADGRIAWRVATADLVDTTTHDGSSWAKIEDRRVYLNVLLADPSPVFVGIRAIAREATHVVVSIDGLLLGTLRLSRNEIKVASTATTELPMDAGLHQISLHFRGGLASAVGPLAEVDWVRLGTPDDLTRTYGAPTQEDVVVATAEMAGVPHRALAPRAPGAVRCPLLVPRGGRLRTAVGMRGTGSAKVQVRVRRDGLPMELLRSLSVSGGAEAAWTNLDIPLDAFESEFVGLELAVTESTGTGRLVFGDPVVAVPDVEPVATALAQLGVLLTLSGIERSDLPPWRVAGAPHLPTLTKLSQTLTVFDDHRAPASLTAASMASLLTGRSPRIHQLADAGARLPNAVPTLATLARGASVRAAMFTGIPTTFGAFGFGEDWELFRQYSPVEGRLASAPVDDALAWLADVAKPGSDARPALAVIHARGGHPPWDLTPPEASTLPPNDYAGYISPRRSAELLATAREKRTKLSEADLERLDALFHAALSREDEAIGRLVDKLEQAGLWDRTLFIVTGDVASARSRLFADGGELDEDVLRLPLLVHFPGGDHAPARVSEATDVYDIHRTLLGALGIKPPAAPDGRDLSAVVSGTAVDLPRSRIAYTDAHYSARLGSFVLLGEVDEPPTLCALEVDPTCFFDRRPFYPALTEALFRDLASRERRAAEHPAREPVTIDSELAATLKVWGAY